MNSISRRNLLKGGVGGLGSLLVGDVHAQLLPPGQRTPSLSIRSRTLFLDNWKFLWYDPPGAQQSYYDDSVWRDVQLPHDWSIEGPFNENNPSTSNGGYMPMGVGWYRKTFAPPTLSPRQRVLIEFEGIYRYSEVWLNGQALGLRPSGFTGFEYDLTPFIVPGVANFLAVRVDNTHQPNLRWYSGSGIYRYAWLTIADRVRVDYNGTYITTKSISPDSAIVRVMATVINGDTADASIRVRMALFDDQGSVVGNNDSGQTITAGSTVTFTQDFIIASPRLWSTSHPTIYSAHFQVRQDGLLIDDEIATFGIRQIRFDPDQGVFLNEQHIKLKGVSMHHDLGCVGAAVHPRSIERRLLAVQSLGCNAIRTSHNPPSPQFLNLCDQMGFLVIDEAFDKWFGDTDDLGPGDLRLLDWWQEDLRSMLRRDRNHPCIILWSVGNEAGIPGSEQHDYILKLLVDFVHNEEPTRPVTCALVPVDISADDEVAGVIRSSTLVDVLSVNYQEAFFDQLHALAPNKPILSTESFPFYLRTESNVVDTGNPTPTNAWNLVASRDFVAGEFVWNGVDHLGESTGWPSRGWATGLFNSCAFPKPAAGYFQAVWRSDPTVRASVLSNTISRDPGFAPWQWPDAAEHWNFASLEGQLLQVNTVSNCDTVELIVNGQSFGQLRPLDFPNQTIPWQVPYAPGIVQALGRNGGQAAVSHLLQTAGVPVKIDLQPDRSYIAADGLEVTHVAASLLDANGVLVPDQDMSLQFFVSGPARLIGVDNGDSRSMESYQGPFRMTFNGRALAVIRSTGLSGQVVLYASANGLPVAAAGMIAGS